MDNEKHSFDSGSTITDGKATPVPAVAPQSFFKVAPLRMTLVNGNRSVMGNVPYKDHYAIWTASADYFIVTREWVHRQPRLLLDMIFGKDSLKDISGLPAAILPDYDNNVLGMFGMWTDNCGSRSMKPNRLFKEKVCTRKERVQNLDFIMELIFFADRYSLYEFQDELLELFIEISKEDSLPLDTVHILKFHKQVSQNSKVRAFLVDFVVFIIKEIEDSGKSKKRKAALNCDLSFNKRESLVELLHLLNGGKIRSPYRKLSDPRDAPSCIYHHHGREEKCPHRTIVSFFISKTCKEKA